MRNQGFIKYVILIIILIAILSYFKINIKSIAESEIFKENFGYVWNWCKDVWDKYLAKPAEYLWNDIFIDLIWNPFVEMLKRIKEGGNIIEQVPKLP